MFDLFRFVFLRPAGPVARDAAIVLDGESPLLADLVAARASNPPLPAMRRVADAFLSSPEFLADPRAQPRAAALLALFEGLSTGDVADMPALEALIETRLGTPASQVVLDPGWSALRGRVRDSLVVAMISLDARAAAAPLTGSMRMMDLVERAAAGDSALSEPGGIAAALTRPVVLPAGLFPLPRATREALPQPRGEGEGTAGRRDDAPEAARARARALQYALDELTAVDSRYVVSLPPATSLSTDLLPASLGSVERPPTLLAPPLSTVAAREAMVTGFGGMTGGTVLSVDLRLTAEGRARITPATATTMRELSVDLADTTLPVAISRIHASLADLEPRLNGGLAGTVTNIGAVGSGLFPISGIPDLLLAGRPAAPLPVTLPSTHAKVQPVGIGDLLVVKQQLVGYEPGEVAHIENILRGELHDRKTRRAETIEETTTTETESIKEEERDLQTTERFEMRRESEAVASMDGKLRGTSMSSPGFGGLVEFDNSKDSPVTGSQQLSEKQASTYGRDVTSRAASKITERIRTQIVKRVVREFEEQIQHRFENATGNANVSGVYQWVDKLVEAQVYNYGKRLLYDIVVPEPAAFLILALARTRSEGRELTKPEPFTLTPTQITESNYATYVARYGVVGVEPPPALYVTTCKVFSGMPAKLNGEPQAVELPLPAGYSAYSGWARFTGPSYQMPPPAKPGETYVAPGISWIVSDNGPYFLNMKNASQSYAFTYPLYGAVDKLPIALTTWYITQYAVAFGITCKRTPEKLATWQARAFDSIQQAYRKKLAEYEERLANLQTSLRVGAAGYSSEQKRLFERAELKKGCLSMLTYQYFDVFDGLEFSYQTDPVTGTSIGYPQPRLPDAEALGKYIRFFEQAFEWEQMMFTFYPYFWGRKDHWMSRVGIDDRDAQFAQFLQAGAARVVLSVRPRFETAVLHFMETGEIWEGGELPSVTSTAYVPLLAELQARAGMQKDEVPYGDPWRVKLPSTLVKLRADDKLPRWKKVVDEWVPDEGA